MNWAFYSSHRLTSSSSPPSLQNSCQKKCIPNDYREGELNKGESVCLDRCTAKFLDTSMKVSEIMQQQGQALGGQQGGGMF